MNLCCPISFILHHNPIQSSFSTGAATEGDLRISLANLSAKLSSRVLAYSTPTSLLLSPTPLNNEEWDTIFSNFGKFLFSVDDYLRLVLPVPDCCLSPSPDKRCRQVDILTVKWLQSLSTITSNLWILEAKGYSLLTLWASLFRFTLIEFNRRSPGLIKPHYLARIWGPIRAFRHHWGQVYCCWRRSGSRGYPTCWSCFCCWPRYLV
jgi:hypothetical protein